MKMANEFVCVGVRGCFVVLLFFYCLFVCFCFCFFYFFVFLQQAVK